MIRERPGNVVVISGNNALKSKYILDCVQAGLNVLALGVIHWLLPNLEMMSLEKTISESKLLLAYEQIDQS